MTELDERKAAVLRAIVEQYVDTAQPVGSQTVTSMTGLGVSAATVRNEMSLLERDGYIAQPHPSAGRVPTDRGYRYYVDHLGAAGQLPVTERRRIVDVGRERFAGILHDPPYVDRRPPSHHLRAADLDADQDPGCARRPIDRLREAQGSP